VRCENIFFFTLGTVVGFMRLSDTLQPPSGTGCGITSQRFNFCTVLDALLNPLDFLTRHTHLCRQGVAKLRNGLNFDTIVITLLNL